MNFEFEEVAVIAVGTVAGLVILAAVFYFMPDTPGVKQVRQGLQGG